ncbi:MAG: hypothetical protein PWQ82_739 [Thermosediminibacterales bacterium]|nr:hypothetical protein [Thermosediminibacterales bacterium]MDK2836124.1 hypothetical protein [Thermosediminibacterales bacterium]
MKRSLVYTFNPLGAVLIVLLIIIVSGSLALLLLISNPDSFGIVTNDFSFNEVYSFQKFDFSSDFISFSIKDAGYLIPGYIDDSVYGITIIGNGSYVLKSPDKELQGSFDALFMPLSPERYMQIRDGFLVKKIYNSEPLEKARKIFEENKTSFFHIVLFNHIRSFIPDPDIYLGSIYSQNRGMIRFIEAKNVTFIPEKGEKINFRNPKACSEYPPNNLLPITFLGLIIITLIFSLTIYILTLDLNTKKNSYLFKDINSKAQKTNLQLTILIISFVVVFSLNTLYHILNNSDLIYPIFAALSLVIMMKKGYTFLGIGINNSNFLRCVFLGLIIAIMGILIGSMGVIPRGLDTPPVKLILVSFLIGLSKEIFFRGFIQNSLEKAFGFLPSLLITPFLIGLLHFIPNLLLPNGVDSSSLFNSFAVIPSVSFILGYSFYKTRSLVPSTIFQTLINLVPLTLIY